jgi:hypothetical protein
MIEKLGFWGWRFSSGDIVRIKQGCFLPFKNYNLTFFIKLPDGTEGKFDKKEEEEIIYCKPNTIFFLNIVNEGRFLGEFLEFRDDNVYVRSFETGEIREIFFLDILTYMEKI